MYYKKENFKTFNDFQVVQSILLLIEYTNIYYNANTFCTMMELEEREDI